MRGGMEKSIAKELMTGIAREVGKEIRNAGVEICNGLSAAGPAWSGRFSASWDIVPAGSSPRERRIGELFDTYEYSYKNFPLKIFEEAITSRSVTTFNIVNTAPYADQAIDAAEGFFQRPDSRPIKRFVEEGFRPYDYVEMQPIEHLRWQLDPGPRYDKNDQPLEPDSAITAERDWFSTYTLGGKLQRDLSRGMKIKTPGTL